MLSESHSQRNQKRSHAIAANFGCHRRYYVVYTFIPHKFQSTWVGVAGAILRLVYLTLDGFLLYCIVSRLSVS